MDPSTQPSSGQRNARRRRRRRSRWTKLGVVVVVAALFAGGGYLLATAVGNSTTQPSWATIPASAPGSGPSTSLAASPSSDDTSSTTATTTPPAGRQVAAIVYLEAGGLPSGTLDALQALHATEVYLYVAYYSDAYYSIPKNPYGMALPADSLGAALKQLHDKGYRVIGVISSALLDWRQAPAAGLAILQDPQKPIFDPVKAATFVEQLVETLVVYPIDGIYVGEPYWLTSTSDVNKKMAWNRLFESLLAITQPARIPFHMVMPAYNGYFTLAPSFAALPFSTIGMDAEFAYYTSDRTKNLDYFKQFVDIAMSLASGRPAIIEVNLHQAFTTSPVPVDFLVQELSYAKQAGIRTVLVFAATFWKSMPNQAQYSAAFADFLAP